MISVIIPVYNTERWLPECLDSLLAQKESDWEGILVDDGSTDSSADICRRYCAADPRFRLVSRRNGGLSAARNAGLEHARGEYIAFIDSDDTVLPGYLSTLLDGLKGNDARIASVGITTLSADTRRPRCILSGEEAVESILYQTSPLTTSACGKLFRKELWNDVRFREGTTYEDLDIIYRILLRAGKVSVSSEALYVYRSTPGSITRTLSPNRADVLDVTRRICSAMAAVSPRLERAALDRRLSACFNILSLIDLNPGYLRERRKECVDTIRRLWPRSLFNRRVRLKNKAGIILWLLSFGQCFRLLRILRRCK